jgi:hypothetical protein
MFAARRTIYAALYRPAGTREALPGAMPFHISAERRGLAPDFLLLPRISFDGLKLKVFGPNSLLSVRKQELHVPLIGGAHQRKLLQLAHAAGFLSAEQMAFPGMHAKNFAGGGDLEAFLSAPVSLQLHFGLGAIPWHL